ncbi:hypothetical protein EDO6_05162 [Paenibacillus xylanexedens]|nr:hypothetical protein EDO6_05162 [Paenibacillus xylanexedens]
MSWIQNKATTTMTSAYEKDTDYEVELIRRITYGFTRDIGLGA